MRKISFVLVVVMFLSGSGFVKNAYAKMLSPVPISSSEEQSLQIAEDCTSSSVKEIRAGDSSDDVLVGVVVGLGLLGLLVAVAKKKNSTD